MLDPSLRREPDLSEWLAFHSDPAAPGEEASDVRETQRHCCTEGFDPHSRSSSAGAAVTAMRSCITLL
jgi:hypothetical protein